jgi:hypothetical protein
MWGVTPCSLVNIYRSFRGSSYLYHQNRLAMPRVFFETPVCTCQTRRRHTPVQRSLQIVNCSGIPNSSWLTQELYTTVMDFQTLVSHTNTATVFSDHLIAQRCKQRSVNSTEIVLANCGRALGKREQDILFAHPSPNRVPFEKRSEILPLCFYER